MSFWVEWTLWIQLQRSLWLMTRAFPWKQPESVNGVCVTEWEHKWVDSSLSAYKGTVRKWSMQRNLPCEQSPEPRVSGSLYHISSQESTLFLVRKLLLVHTSVFCFWVIMAWSPCVHGQASSPCFFFVMAAPWPETSKPLTSVNHIQKWPQVSSGLNVWPHGMLPETPAFPSSFVFGAELDLFL